MSENPHEEIAQKWNYLISEWEKNNIEQVLTVFTEDALHIPPGFETNQGKDQIRDFYLNIFSQHSSSKYTHQTIKIDFEEKTAIEYAKFKVDWIRKDGDKWTFDARCVVHWTQAENGKWLIKLFIYNLTN